MHVQREISFVRPFWEWFIAITVIHLAPATSASAPATFFQLYKLYTTKHLLFDTINRNFSVFGKWNWPTILFPGVPANYAIVTRSGNQHRNFHNAWDQYRKRRSSGTTLYVQSQRTKINEALKCCCVAQATHFAQYFKN